MLSDFEGKQVVRSTIAITNAGDGLSDSMMVEPTEFHHGDRVFVLLECEVADVSFPPDDPKIIEGDLKRLHKFKAGTAMICDAETVDILQTKVEEHTERIIKHREEEAGITRLDFDADPEGGLPDDVPGLDDFEANTAEALADQARDEALLFTLTKEELRGLVGRHGLEAAPKAQGRTLVKLLLSVPGIADQAQDVIAARDDGDEAPDNVRDIGGTGG